MNALDDELLPPLEPAGLHVAVVGTEQTTVGVAGKLLVSAGFQVHNYATGAELLRALNKPEPSFASLLVHSVLPDTHALQLLPKIRQCVYGALPSIIVTTISETTESSGQYFRRGASDFTTQSTMAGTLVNRILLHANYLRLQGLVAQNPPRRAGGEVPESPRVRTHLYTEAQNKLAGAEQRIAELQEELKVERVIAKVLREKLTAATFKAAHSDEVREAESEKKAKVRSLLRERRLEADQQSAASTDISLDLTPPTPITNTSLTSFHDVAEQLRKAFETPLQVLSRTLTTMISDTKSLDTDERSRLLDAVDQLHSPNLMRPEMSSIKNALSWDSTAVAFLENEFAPRSVDKVTSSSSLQRLASTNNMLRSKGRSMKDLSDMVDSSSGSGPLSLSIHDTQPRGFQRQPTAELPVVTANSTMSSDKLPAVGNSSLTKLPKSLSHLDLQKVSEIDGIVRDFGTTTPRVWGVDVLAMGDAELVGLVESIFEDLGLFESHPLDRTRFRFFVEAVRRQYRDNPYHNFRHCVDVLHFCFMLTTETEAGMLFTDVELLALALAALCHDVDHPGHNNAFSIETADDLALLYNDQSVLENHHCATTFKLLAHDSRANFLHRLERSAFKELRSLIVGAVLKTDMSKHFELISQVSTMLSKPLSIAEASDRAFVLQLVLHAADISTGCKEWVLSAKWSFRVVEEFFLQGDRERERGLPVAPFMDRHSAVIPKTQTDFIDFVCVPFYNSLADMFPSSKIMADRLRANRDVWASMYDHPPTSLEEALALTGSADPVVPRVVEAPKRGEPEPAPEPEPEESDPVGKDVNRSMVSLGAASLGLEEIVRLDLPGVDRPVRLVDTFSLTSLPLLPGATRTQDAFSVSRSRPAAALHSGLPLVSSTAKLHHPTPAPQPPPRVPHRDMQFSPRKQRQARRAPPPATVSDRRVVPLEVSRRGR